MQSSIDLNRAHPKDSLPSHPQHPAGDGKGMVATSQSAAYKKAYAVAKSIPKHKNKRAAIRYWCLCAKAMLK